MYSKRLLIADLKTDMRYQSPIRESQVRKIVRNFDPDKLDTITVNKRQDGTFYIIDGQHRVEALKELNIQFAQANIYDNLTPEKEAEMYYGINDRPAKSPNSKAKSKLMFGEQSAIEIEQAVINAGLKIDYDKKLPSDGYITAYASLESIYKKYNKKLLEIVLKIIKESFGTDSKNYQAFMIKGFAQFIDIYHRDVDVMNLISKLQELGYDGFIKEVNKNAAGFSTKKESLPLTLVEIYNKRKHAKNKLDKRLLFF
ncbi:DUF6551 family protein [Mammaliicoccus sciuri]|uniref:DUF6551 family protein n=1 Tax=Mammaliicoccus sciuri TaxID=1296 RepID=UPI00194F2A84|nr:DUF6551 family protein [Mammaliicoccus sciuri]MEB5757441.1 ParB N-terminal domain-containing protein [Mammaliicoccus sciuri]